MSVTSLADETKRDSSFQGSFSMRNANKTSTIAEAATLVRSGQILALGGFTLYRRPVAFVRALLKTAIQDLTLLSYTASYESDLLVAAGCLRAVRTCYFGFESFGLAPAFTREVGAGRVRVIEESEASLAFGLRATLAGVGFMPGQGWLGTDLLRVRPDVKVITCPYTQKAVVAFPAIATDVAVIHVPIADHFGNARLLGNLSVDRELSLVAPTVILTAEEVVDSLDAPIDIAGLNVTSVVHAPRGAWPTSCYPLYPLDGEEILRYQNFSEEGRLDEYLASLD